MAWGQSLSKRGGRAATSAKIHAMNMQSSPAATGADTAKAASEAAPTLARSDQNLVWIDCEMTGLDPEVERLIEIAVVVTGPHLEPRIEGPVLVIHQSDAVLDAMLLLARDHSFSVTVLATGHPSEVFETPSVSNHTEGRGVDIWAVDGVPVVAQRTDGSVVEVMVRELLGAGVTEIGSPWDIDGPGGPSFTNVVHQDHLHVATGDLHRPPLEEPSHRRFLIYDGLS